MGLNLNLVDEAFPVHYMLLYMLKKWISYTRSREFSVFHHKK